MRRGMQAELLEAWRSRRFLLLTSDFILNEVEEVLSQPSLRKKYHLQENQTEKLIRLLQMDSLRVSGRIRLEVCRDPDDDAILGCAIEGGANYLITGDKDLLVLKEFRGVRILNARYYVEQLRLE